MYCTHIYNGCGTQRTAEQRGDGEPTFSGGHTHSVTHLTSPTHTSHISIALVKIKMLHRESTIKECLLASPYISIHGHKGVEGIVEQGGCDLVSRIHVFCYFCSPFNAYKTLFLLFRDIRTNARPNKTGWANTGTGTVQSFHMQSFPVYPCDSCDEGGFLGGEMR